MAKFLLIKSVRINTPAIYYWQADQIVIEAKRAEGAQLLAQLIQMSRLPCGGTVDCEFLGPYSGGLLPIPLGAYARFVVLDLFYALTEEERAECKRLWAAVSQKSESMDPIVRYVLNKKLPALLEEL